MVGRCRLTGKGCGRSAERPYREAMGSSLLAVTFEVLHPTQVAHFGAHMLSRNVDETSEGALLPGGATQLGLRFAPSRTERSGRNRAHIHLTSTSDADQQ